MLNPKLFLIAAVVSFSVTGSAQAQESVLQNSSESVDALIGVDPRSKVQSGTGAAYDEFLGPQDPVPLDVPLDEDASFYGNSQYFTGLRSPLYEEVETQSNAWDEPISNKEFDLPSDLDLPMDDLDAPLVEDSYDY